jgi:hypothetical protein
MHPPKRNGARSSINWSMARQLGYPYTTRGSGLAHRGHSLAARGWYFRFGMISSPIRCFAYAAYGLLEVAHVCAPFPPCASRAKTKTWCEAQTSQRWEIASLLSGNRGGD